jgi:hypothetical protein
MATAVADSPSDQGEDMTLRGTLAISVALIAFSSPFDGTANASSMTGRQLFSLCTANMNGAGNPLEAAECLGFVVGVSDTFNCTQNDHGFTWDSSMSVSQPELVAAVVKWLQAHPAALEYEGHRVVGAALQAAFPCTK